MSTKVKNSLLLLTQTFHELRKNTKFLLEESFKHTNSNLFIYINPFLSNSNSPQQTYLTNKSNLINRLELKLLINQFYSHSFKINPNINVVCLLHNIHNEFLKSNSSSESLKLNQDFSYDLVLVDSLDATNDFSHFDNYLKSNLPTFNSHQAIKFEKILLPKSEEAIEQASLPPTTEHNLIAKDNVYMNSIMGGTFDRLHNGHKIMLSESVLLTKSKLLIGLSDEPLLVNKKLAELIQPMQEREANLRRFLSLIAPQLEVSIVPIEDPFGPSITERDYQCLIVSEETKKGGKMINEKRAENNLPLLDIHIVDLVKDDEALLKQNEGDEDKVSSSNERRRLLGTLLKAPYIDFDSKKPYVIGLTGGLASGKSSIRNDLENLGAATIDCDKLGHKTYEKGTDAYARLVDTFGKDILDDMGEINRKVLGQRVFNSASELKKLTDIVWPCIRKLVDLEIERLFQNGHRIIIVEAAVLLEANWQTNMNEIWVVFVPYNEALNRAMSRDKSNEEKVKGTLNSQLSNKERLKQANVAFCSLWEREYTIKQVKKAWQLLLNRTK